MLSKLKLLLLPLKMLHQVIRIFRGKNLSNLYYAFFKYNSLKLISANDFSTVKGGCREVKYYYNKNVKFPHPVGIVIGKNVTLGLNCTIFQSVTIGSNGSMEQPNIGDNVTIYAGSVVIGSITIGNGVVIGANSFVNESIPDNAIVAGCPAKIIGFSE